MGEKDGRADLPQTCCGYVVPQAEHERRQQHDPEKWRQLSQVVAPSM
jgi:hypothetical protein